MVLESKLKSITQRQTTVTWRLFPHISSASGPCLPSVRPATGEALMSLLQKGRGRADYGWLRILVQVLAGLSKDSPRLGKQSIVSPNSYTLQCTLALLHAFDSQSRHSERRLLSPRNATMAENPSGTWRQEMESQHSQEYQRHRLPLRELQDEDTGCLQQIVCCRNVLFHQAKGEKKWKELWQKCKRKEKKLRVRKLLSGAQSHSGSRVPVQVAPYLIPLPIICMRKQWKLAQVLRTCTKMGNLDLVPGSWAQSGPALATVAIWGMNKQMKDVSAFQINNFLKGKAIIQRGQKIKIGYDLTLVNKSKNKTDNDFCYLGFAQQVLTVRLRPSLQILPHEPALHSSF